MTSNSFKFVFLFILVSVFNLATPDTIFPDSSCSDDKATANSTYQENVRTILLSLSLKATVTAFYNDTIGGRSALNPVYGLFMCRGDVPSHLCGQCVLNATQTLSSECYLSKRAIYWREECMVRYSNNSFFSTWETIPWHASSHWSYPDDITSQLSFMHLLTNTINKTADGLAFSHAGARYATKEAYVSENQTLYCLVQCTPDLSPQDCRACLANATSVVPACCERRSGVAVFLPSCNLRYELYPFYRVNYLGGLAPATKYSEIDSKYSQNPGYLSHSCSSDMDHNWQPQLRALLANLSSNAIGSDNNGFFKTDINGTAFGLYMCRGDIPSRLCEQCVVNATHRVASECRSSIEGIVWYNHCLLRYSNHLFFNTRSLSPRFDMLNVTNVNSEERSFKFQLSNALAEVALNMQISDKSYWTESLRLNDYQTIYILAQCTSDLSSGDCGGCVFHVVVSRIPWSRLGSVGGRVLYPSCTVRFELFPFYMTTEDQPLPPPSPSPARTEKKDRPRPITLIVASIIVSVILCCFCCYLLRRKAGKNHKTILRENFGDEITTVESLQFDLAVIESATNNFSPDNWIGKGGFGEVYKGILFDGRHIAVKRLSRSSTQGIAEFKNEILLIAKLQHRNLVAFMGFCLEEQAKILVYEYVPNKSLDYFLFDAREKSLSWSERHKIIEGIARGILYLHEYSRLRVIHRDLKPSNVLLDENMNPKISDFGLAKIVEIDQQRASTNNIVGTFGYMSPEYAMLGRYSEKSDIFSFGVMVLEIITGTKHTSSYESHHVAYGLLSFVWRQYMDQTPLNILDPRLKENVSEFEVIRYIQIGLLCVQEDPDDRPTMMTIVSYFSNQLIELPSPREPAFFLRHKMDAKIVSQESCYSSVNAMSISNFFPR